MMILSVMLTIKLFNVLSKKMLHRIARFCKLRELRKCQDLPIVVTAIFRFNISLQMKVTKTLGQSIIKLASLGLTQWLFKKYKSSAVNCPASCGILGTSSRKPHHCLRYTNHNKNDNKQRPRNDCSPWKEAWSVSVPLLYCFRMKCLAHRRFLMNQFRHLRPKRAFLFPENTYAPTKGYFSYVTYG